jgi:cytoskeletal protein RodZ
MTPPEEPPAPSLSTAPAEGSGSSRTSPDTPLRRRRLPSHVGPARTSTVLLAVAFLAIGMLYLFVKPPEPSTAADTGTGSSSPSRSSEPGQVPATTAPSTTASTSESATPTETTTPESTTPTEETTESPVETTPESTAPEATDLPTTEPAPTTEPTP